MSKTVVNGVVVSRNTVVGVQGPQGPIGATGPQGDPGVVGGASVTDEVLKMWTEGEAFEATSVTRDSDGVVTTATVVWPDGSAGTFTTTTKNTTWLAVDAFQITHSDSGKTVVQSSVTRDSDGLVTTKPALTVA